MVWETKKRAEAANQAQDAKECLAERTGHCHQVFVLIRFEAGQTKIDNLPVVRKANKLKRVCFAENFILFAHL